MPAADLRSGSTRGESPAFRPGSPLHDQDLKGLGLALVGVVDLTADLARREHRRVDVHVRNAGAHRSDELAELARRYALARRSDDISGGDGSGDHALLWARRLATAAPAELDYAARRQPVHRQKIREGPRTFEA